MLDEKSLGLLAAAADIRAGMVVDPLTAPLIPFRQMGHV